MKADGNIKFCCFCEYREELRLIVKVSLKLSGQECPAETVLPHTAFEFLCGGCRVSHRECREPCEPVGVFSYAFGENVVSAGANPHCLRGRDFV